MSLPILNRPDVLGVLFHPRRDYGLGYSTPGIRLIDVEVAPGVCVGGRLYPASGSAPVILYFHGNGEIAADYDDIVVGYTRMGITLLVMDYRGYGRSDGSPSAGELLTDAVMVYQRLGRIFDENYLVPSECYVMGRSLGSAAAIEVAVNAGDELAGLIIESGFADTFSLLGRLGVQVGETDEDRDGFGNLSKIGKIKAPTLVIHGQRDVLIPPADGRQLYERCAASDKRLVLIPGAGHNDLMVVGRTQYFEAIGKFII